MIRPVGEEPVGVGGVVAVKAEQGVEVDGAAGLVFGGLAVGDADLRRPCRRDRTGAAAAGELGR